MAKPSKSRSVKKKATKAKRSAPKPKPRPKKAAAKRPASKAAKKSATAAKATIAKRARKTTAKKAVKRSAPKAAKKAPKAAVYTVGVCNDWNAPAGSQVNFTNPNATTTCNITSVVNSTWPFTDPSPIPVPPSGATTHLKPAEVLPDNTYYYNVDCCETMTRKSVTVP